MKTLNVAVVGSGPAGLYTAEALIKQGAALDPPCTVLVDVLDRLPTPYGLVRYGVAPDHKSIKSIADYLRGVLEHEGVRFIGGVHLGDDVTRADLLSCYDAVVYATGAMRDRRLGIPGEDVPGSIAATDFVNWYCGHPDVDPDRFVLDAESVAVIGVGNVAVDVARILIRDPEELRETDVSQPVLDVLLDEQGPRGPRDRQARAGQAKFTTKELRELGELAGVDVVVGEGEAELDAFDATGESSRLATQDRHVRGNYTVISDWAARIPAGAARRLTLRFWLSPARGARHRAGRGPDGRAHQAGRRRAAGRDRRVREAAGPDGAAQRRLPERPAARRAVRRPGEHRPERRRPRARPGRRAAAGGVRGRLAQARPDRRDRHQQVRRRADGPQPAGRPGGRAGPG